MKFSVKNIIICLLAWCALGSFTACNDDEEDRIEVNEGVVFTLTRKMAYTTGVNEIGSIKITLSDGQKKIALPSLALKGDEDLIKSAPCALAAGDYAVVAYTAYSTRHEFLFDAELDSKNQFTVTPHEVVEFKIPIKTREIMSVNFLRNAMMGICREVFGEDESQWPWNPKKYPYPDWEGLEFELDDYGSPMYLSGITFMGMKDGQPTPWAKMTALPEGTLSNIAELASINIIDIPAFKQLPSDLDRLPNLQQISCIHTGIEEIPSNVFQMKTLAGLIFMDSELRDFSYDLSALENLRLLVLSGNHLEKFATPLHGLKHLVSLDLSHNPLQTIDEACFDGTTGLSALTLTGTQLTDLPAALAKETTLRRIDLSDAQCSRVPAVLNQLPGLKTILLDHNPMTNFSAQELAQVDALENLSLAGNAIGALPVLSNAHLAWLDLTDCGLTSVPDLTAYEELSVVSMGGNHWTSIPEGYFSRNKQVRIVNLSHSTELTSLPADLGLQPIREDGREGFRLLEVEDCPLLNWTTPASWKAYDFTQGNDWIFDPATAAEIHANENLFGDVCWGRVGIRRSNSPQVQLGE